MTRQEFEALKIGNSVYCKTGGNKSKEYWSCEVTDIDRLSGRIAAVGIKKYHYSYLKRKIKKDERVMAFLGLGIYPSNLSVNYA